MTKIDDVFSAFGDGKGHDVGEIAGDVSLPESKVLKILDFLAEFNFIEFDRGRGKARASPVGMRSLSTFRESKTTSHHFFFKRG